MGQDIVKWADQAMFEAAPMKKDLRGKIVPQVFLLSATPDPLGAVAAACRMYEGKPTYDLADVTDDERHHYWEQSIATHLKAPWEFIDLHFFIEAVTRSFTHQMVRQRTAVFAQESLRFAVKEGLAQEVPLPPSITDNGEGPAKIWGDAVAAMEQAYTALVNAGIPAEDARGLLPHSVTTRLNYKTNFRNLVEHAGNRLCTQAQFEWRHVFLGIMRSIRGYTPPLAWNTQQRDDSWQFKTLGSPLAQTFAPVCYHVGHCTFKATFDRQCTIRDRVDRLAELGVPATEWGTRDRTNPEADGIERIDPAEWMADPTAGRRD